MVQTSDNISPSIRIVEAIQATMADWCVESQVLWRQAYQKYRATSGTKSSFSSSKFVGGCDEIVTSTDKFVALPCGHQQRMRMISQK
jgi:hypothetical protein